jgi:hypothetical protein
MGLSVDAHAGENAHPLRRAKSLSEPKLLKTMSRWARRLASPDSVRSPVTYLYMDRFSEFAARHLRRKGD